MIAKEISHLTLGNKVKLERIRQKLRQIDVASLAKVTLSDVINTEKDRWLLRTKILKILEALNMVNEIETLRKEHEIWLNTYPLAPSKWSSKKNWDEYNKGERGKVEP